MIGATTGLQYHCLRIREWSDEVQHHGRSLHKTDSSTLSRKSPRSPKQIQCESLDPYYDPANEDDKAGIGNHIEVRCGAANARQDGRSLRRYFHGRGRVRRGKSGRPGVPWGIPWRGAALRSLNRGRCGGMQAKYAIIPGHERGRGGRARTRSSSSNSQATGRHDASRNANTLSDAYPFPLCVQVLCGGPNEGSPPPPTNWAPEIARWAGCRGRSLQCGLWHFPRDALGNKRG